jgi:acetate kinase
MHVAVVNAGSSGVKLGLVGGSDATVAQRELPATRATVDSREPSAVIHEGFAEADVVGHRIAHGGVFP